MTFAMVWSLGEYGFEDPQTPAQALRIEETLSVIYPTMLIFAAVMWLLLFMSLIFSEWTALTAKEIEAEERRVLAYLQKKYQSSDFDSQ
jgi:hypothetical protein